jgi:hypothetical protein
MPGRARFWTMVGVCAMMASDCLAQLPDLSTVPPDLVVPAMQEGTPGSGLRVRQTASGWEGTQVHHALYLPRDWEPGRRYPVIVEYAGNGGFRNAYGDVCTGRVEDCHMGYGLSAGVGFIWVAMPFVDSAAGANALTWWGDVEASVRYCKQAVREVCEAWGGDPARVILCGFSRGSIACNYIGLHDDDIARLWRGFLCCSHYDGVRTWPYPDSDAASALARLKRLGDRPQFICQEGSTGATETYLKGAGVTGAFTFCTVPFRNHSDEWTLRDCTARQAARRWLAQVAGTQG